MMVKIVGIQSQDYKLDNGYEFKGNKIHALDLDSQPDGLTGNLTMTMKIPVASPLSSVPLVVGAEYNVYFNQKGGVDYISEI